MLALPSVVRGWRRAALGSGVALLTAARAAALSPTPTGRPAVDPGAGTNDAASVEEATELPKLTVGRDLIRTAPDAALLDGAWSAALQIATAFSSSRVRGSQPRGLLAHQATRVLYGSSWTAMLALEAFAVAAAGGGFDFLAEAVYRTDWLVGTTLPSCPSSASLGGCGIGIGGFGGLAMRPKGSALYFEAGGGWLEQRVSTNDRRTLSESMWLLNPITITLPVETPAAPLGLFLRAGPGLYFGMHNAHLHAHRPSGRAGIPWHELFPLDAGLGPGGRAEAGVVLLRRVRLHAELVTALLPLGTRRSSPGDALEPLSPARGVPSFRMFSAGLGYEDPATPMRLGVSLFAAELSSRPYTTFGHRGALLRLEFPLKTNRVPR
jgi:hypothetical protein